jgi:hypothetical protein
MCRYLLFWFTANWTRYELPKEKPPEGGSSIFQTLIAKPTKPNCADQVEAAERAAQGECLTL